MSCPHSTTITGKNEQAGGEDKRCDNTPKQGNRLRSY